MLPTQEVDATLLDGWCQRQPSASSRRRATAAYQRRQRSMSNRAARHEKRVQLHTARLYAVYCKQTLAEARYRPLLDREGSAGSASNMAAAADCIRQQQVTRESRARPQTTVTLRLHAEQREAAGSSSSTTALRLQASGSKLHAGVAPGCKQQHQHQLQTTADCSSTSMLHAEVTPSCSSNSSDSRLQASSSMSLAEAAPGCRQQQQHRLQQAGFM